MAGRARAVDGQRRRSSLRATAASGVVGRDAQNSQEGSLQHASAHASQALQKYASCFSLRTVGAPQEGQCAGVFMFQITSQPV